MLLTIFFVAYILFGAIIFSHAEGWAYLAANFGQMLLF